MGLEARRELTVSLIDKVIGRLRQAAGDVKNDPGRRRDGVVDERRGEARDELRESGQDVERKAAKIVDLERRS
jgi:hypothetical protein